MTAALSVDRLHLRLGGIVAIDGLSIAIAEGEILGIIGPNGAGKTTLIDTICGLHPRASGSITLGDRPILGLPPHRIARAGIGRSFQSGALFPALSVRDNIRVAAEAGGGALASVETLVEELDLTAVAKRLPSALTNAERRRVHLARAVAHQPRVLLLDEPAAGLTPAEAQIFAALVRRVASRLSAAVLLIEHNVSFVANLARRIAVLHFGRLIAQGAPGDVLRSPAVIEAYLGRAS